MKPSNPFSFCALAVFFFLSTGIFLCRKGKEEAAESAGWSPVRVTRIRFLDITETVDLNATTVFLTKETVRVTFQGFIDKIHKTIGDPVKAGDPLFSIKTKELSTGDSVQMDPSLGSFRGAVTIRAKTNGVLTAMNYNVGDFVSDGEQIAVVSNPSSLRITLNVPYPIVSRIPPQAGCSLFLPDGTILPARVDKFIPSVDPASQTQTLLLRLNRPATLPENLNLNVRLPVHVALHAAVLPKSTVMSDEAQERFWVMKLANDSTAVRVDIQKGVENDSLIQIVNPHFTPGNLIVSEGAYGLPDTARVSIGR